jgi:cytoskeletal protein CcmA (bactofilin family)
MAIFGKDGAQQGSRHGTTVISAGSQFVGDVALSDNLHVDGRIEGDVEAEAGVVIGEQGCVKGRIKAGTVVVSGRVEGSIAAKRLEIVAGGVVEGDVRTVDFVIEPGGRFNGSSEILDESPAQEASTPRTAADAKKPKSQAALSGEETPSTP